MIGASEVGTRNPVLSTMMNATQTAVINRAGNKVTRYQDPFFVRAR